MHVAVTAYPVLLHWRLPSPGMYLLYGLAEGRYSPAYGRASACAPFPHADKITDQLSEMVPRYFH